MSSKVRLEDLERVLIDEIEIDGVDYTLVATPTPSDRSNTDPYLGRCRRFEVHGALDPTLDLSSNST